MAGRFTRPTDGEKWRVAAAQGSLASKSGQTTGGFSLSIRVIAAGLFINSVQLEGGGDEGSVQSR
jgi:hypothetical protein